MDFYLVEREENVKADIFAAYITLLRQTRPVASQTLDAEAMDDDSIMASALDIYADESTM